MKKQAKKIAVISGGTGGFTVLSGLKKYDLDITAVVSMADDGGSTGRLRDELGVLPPGDIRQCLVALSKESKALRDLFNYRFESGQLKGHSLGNLFLSASEKMKGSFADGLKTVEKVLNIKGRVLPVTNDNTKLCVELESGEILKGQNEINHYYDLQEEGVKKIFLSPKARANEEALKKIREADLIVIGPGNHYCSVIPNLIVKEIPQAIFESKAKVVYVCNLVNKKGHSEKFDLKDYADSINSFFPKPRIDFVLYNKEKPDEKLSKKYEREGEVLVEYDSSFKAKEYEVVVAEMLSKTVPEYSKADSITDIRSLIRHDSEKLAKQIVGLI